MESGMNGSSFAQQCVKPGFALQLVRALQGGAIPYGTKSLSVHKGGSTPEAWFKTSAAVMLSYSRQETPATNRRRGTPRKRDAKPENRMC